MKILIDDVVYAHQEIFSNFGDITTLAGSDIDNNAIKDFDILIVRSRTKVNKELLKESKIKFIGSTVAGLDHIDENYLQKNNIVFSSAQGCNANAVAEYVISGIVNLAADYEFDLTEKTLAIIGVGNVGSRVDILARQLGIKTLLNDPPRQEREKNIDFVELNDALSADIVSFHTPLTFNGDYPSFNLLGGHNFDLITKDTILINAARGGIIDENIWQKHQTKANIIDCWNDEPQINQSLHKSCYWATPHIAGHSVDAKHMGSYIVYKDLCIFTEQSEDSNIASLLKIPKEIIKHKTLKETINAIYSFAEDDKAIKDISQFEYYRRNYPKRYEWRHFNTYCNMPKAL